MVERPERDGNLAQRVSADQKRHIPFCPDRTAEWCDQMKLTIIHYSSFRGL